MNGAIELETRLGLALPHGVEVAPVEGGLSAELLCPPAALVQLCDDLFNRCALNFAGLVVEEAAAGWQLRYFFYGDDGGPVAVLLRLPPEPTTVPSIVRHVHAADWHEREVEDHFGIVFEGHPRLGDFVLHDDAWQESVRPMRHEFRVDTPVRDRQPRRDGRPQRVLQAPGAFVMPIGPIFAAGAESVHFDLETVGEDVTRAVPRLFYKYRGIEKLAEERSIPEVLAIAERFAATTSFAHAWAYCRAVEMVQRAPVPPRARLLRIFLAELERLRHHAGALHDICASTALQVAESQMALCEEELLRICGALTGHRYLFGLAIPGGLTRDFEGGEIRNALCECRRVERHLDELERTLQSSSSFLDRLEEVGIIGERKAREVGLVGPMARASGIARDLRRAQAYDGYGELAFEVPVEREGDGYARLRVLFAEARQSVSLLGQVEANLRDGPTFAAPQPCAGAALGFVESPRGAAFHWVRLREDGTVERYRVVPPSFVNWLGFHIAVESFAFQDFPIILATLDLSVAETDR